MWFARPKTTAFAIKIKLEQKDLSPPLFIEEVSRCDGGVFKGVLISIAEGRVCQYRRVRFSRPKTTAFAIKIKLEQKDLSPPLFVEEVSRSDGGVFKVVPMGIAGGRRRLK